jgi:hypothetical protein
LVGTKIPNSLQSSYLGVCDFEAAAGYDFTWEFWIKGYENALSTPIPQPIKGYAVNAWPNLGDSP